MTPIKSFNRSNLIQWIFFLIIVSCADAQPSTDPYNSNNYGNNINPSVGIIIIALVVALFLLGFFSMYVRHCTGDDTSYGSALRVSANQVGGRSRRGPRGLDNAVIESFPTFDYSAVKSLHIGKGALECAVCLNEFQDDETLRLIPKCDHVFHPDCIDAWLVAHTTCPVCRAELTPQPGESIHAPNLGPIDDPVVIDVVGGPVLPPVQCEPELMEQPLNPVVPPPVPGLNRSRTRRNASGRPGWLGVLFTRSNSTGHVAVKGRWDNMERFTLRLPEEVRSRIISESLNRNASSVALPRQASSRRGYRAGPGGPTGPGGEGSSRGRRFGSWRFDRAARSDRWAFTLAPPFFTRGPSVRSPKVAAAGGVEGGSVHSSKAAESVHAATSSDTNLPPV